VLQRLITALVLAITTTVLVICTNMQFSSSSDAFTQLSTKTTQLTSLSPSPLSPPSLPTTSPKAHPLPPTLAQWQDRTNSGDYFSQVTPTQLGYLVWSQFPVKVYVQSPPSANNQAEIWINDVLQAVHEWSTYLPLIVVDKPEVADISILRKAPALQISRDNKILRARSAQTTYEFYISPNNLLSHRFTILLSPSQIGHYLTAAARHELGHALGIWGHSPLQSDALYFSQVQNPPPISSRDVNTLKRVYEQPTSLGWPLPKDNRR